LLINANDGNFKNAVDLTVIIVDHLTVSALKTNDMVAADIDNDGFLDIMIGNEDRKNQLFINTGNGNYQNNIINLPGNGTLITYCIVAADLNGGMFDIVVSNINGSNELLVNSNNRSS
jgi:hypothetical protein